MENYFSAPRICYEDRDQLEELLQNSMRKSIENVFERMEITPSDSLPESHRCICSPFRAIELINDGRNAGVMLHNLLFVLRKIEKCSIRKIYKLDTHGVVFILHK